MTDIEIVIQFIDDPIYPKSEVAKSWFSLDEKQRRLAGLMRKLRTWPKVSKEFEFEVYNAYCDSFGYNPKSPVSLEYFKDFCSLQGYELKEV